MKTGEFSGGTEVCKFIWIFLILEGTFGVSETVTQRCSVKKLFLEISQNSQENICARVSFLKKLQAAPATLLKRDSSRGVFLWILRNF